MPNRLLAVVAFTSLLAQACGSSGTTAAPKQNAATDTKVKPLNVRIIAIPRDAVAHVECEGQEVIEHVVPVNVSAPIAEGTKPCELTVTRDGYRTVRATLSRATLIRAGLPIEHSTPGDLQTERTVYDPVTGRRVVVQQTRNPDTIGVDVVLPVELKPVTAP